MDFELTREQQAVRELARDFGLRQVAPVIQRFDEGRNSRRDQASSARPGCRRPRAREIRGAALDYVSTPCRGGAESSTPPSHHLWPQLALPTTSRSRLGDHKARYLPCLARGEMLAPGR